MSAFGKKTRRREDINQVTGEHQGIETMATDNEIVPEYHSDFIGPVGWDREHLEIVRLGKNAIDEWRQQHPDEKLELRNAPLEKTHLAGTHLRKANLKGANLTGANLGGATLGDANLEGTTLWKANLERANLEMADLEGAMLWEANLNGANLGMANLEGASLPFANLEGARLREANLEGTMLWEANLSGANLFEANLKGATLRMAIVDGSTNMSRVKTDANTDLTGVGLANVRIEPRIRSQLEHNVRRIGWQERYKKWWPYWVFPGRLLWLADYGGSTTRLAACFLLLALVFAGVYLIPTEVPPWAPAWWPTFECEPFVQGLDEAVDENGEYRWGLTWCRATYFSIVTMTTLGFGDMHAHPDSAWGHVLLILHVLIGYVLLGALITRFAILFQSVE